MSADKLASFRIDSQLWEQFQGYAKENNVTATALLISYIKSVVNTGNTVNTTVDNVNTTTEKKPSLSIQDIDARIKSSLEDGDIGNAIAQSYENMMGNFNQLVDDIALLKSQLSAISNQQLPVDNTNDQGLDVVTLLGIENIINGDHYDKNSLASLLPKLIENKQKLEQHLNIKLNLDNPNFVVREFNKILKSLGYQWENKQIKTIETYWIKK